jgi:cation diffusion facilitator family transporter
LAAFQIAAFTLGKIFRRNKTKKVPRAKHKHKESRMHQDQIKLWQHQHTFNIDKQHIEKRTLAVVIITFIMMIAEILFGWLTNSMALLADGWHMGTHAFALGISLVAYMLARKHAENLRFTFGTWKIEILGAYSSALVLGMVAIIMVYTSVQRLFHPLSIHYDEALFVAIIGLIVNLASASILNIGKVSHSHNHHHHHDDDTAYHSLDDLNLKSAYLHVIADALTSIFAIVAILGAKYLKFNWLDPLMGIVGAALISRWAALLLKDSGVILLDHEIESPLSTEIRAHIESDGDTRISDLHLWKVADDKYACIISLVTGMNHSIDDYKKRLKEVHELAHTTIEINRCVKIA